MARERMVTRTVVVTNVTVLCVNVLTVDTQILEYQISGSYETHESALKVLKKSYETDTFKVVAVQEMKEQEVLYGMPEIEFIKLAKVLPPR